MGDDLHSVLEVRQAEGDSLTSRRVDKYPALHFISSLYKFLAVTTTIVTFAAIFAVVAASGIPGPAKVQIIVLLIAYMVLCPAFLWGAGELILLLINIEKNTRPR